MVNFRPLVRWAWRGVRGVVLGEELSLSLSFKFSNCISPLTIIATSLLLGSGWMELERLRIGGKERGERWHGGSLNTSTFIERMHGEKHVVEHVWISCDFLIMVAEDERGRDSGDPRGEWEECGELERGWGEKEREGEAEGVGEREGGIWGELLWLEVPVLEDNSWVSYEREGDGGGERGKEERGKGGETWMQEEESRDNLGIESDAELEDEVAARYLNCESTTEPYKSNLDSFPKYPIMKHNPQNKVMMSNTSTR